MNNIVHTFWIGGPLDEVSWLSLSSFVKHGFQVNLWCYPPALKQVPYGVILCDASTVLPESVTYQHRLGSWAPFSDWFRFALLYKHGGIWADTDIICLRPFDIPPNTYCGETDDKASIGFISMEKAHPLAKYMADACEDPRNTPDFDNPVRIIINDIMQRMQLTKEEARLRAPWSYTGNELLQHVIKDYAMVRLPTKDIYPISYHEAETIVNGTASLADLNGSKCVHLWRSALHNKLSGTKECLFSQLKQLILN